MLQHFAGNGKGFEDGRGRAISCGIGVEHKQDGAGGCEPFDVGQRKSGSEESDDVWESGLCDAHDSPWTFDQDDALASERLGTVCIVEDLGFGEVSGETPFAKASHLVWVDSAAAITEGTSVDIVESHGNRVFEEWGEVGGAGLKPCSGDRHYRFDILKEMTRGIEGDGSSEGSEGSAACASRACLLPGMRL
jgi:hypothetical protein